MKSDGTSIVLPDWGTYAAPGALDLMRTKAATRMGGIELIDCAGHWIQQEQPVRLSTLLLAFIKEAGGTDHSGDFGLGSR
ncbi:hypothetical protein NLM27_20055 [Bradyrhizobium sp. CCGB12]|uniref:hypothetical protein n=1 Tax=Bradyrhizobium sp. CCGB12 TaxID=2949632 RepID=UPI0020B1D805|nr:hypothetical protein [Bradyrhizobium sp. CCGB12]MCP3391080.1 hypothetical protein [Bradyrhizobium sp. CCGB12]